MPARLGDVFSVAAAIEAGVSPDALRRVAFRSPYPGLRSQAPAPPVDDLRARCAELAPRLRDWQFFSHETTLALLEIPTPSLPYRPRVHVSAHRPSREPRIAGVVGHRLQTRVTAVSTSSGLPLEHPVRAWRQAGTLWALDDLVAAADALVSGEHPNASLDDLREEVAAMGDVRGGILTESLRLARVGSRSPRETKLRLLLVRAHLPEPEINWTLRDSSGGFVAELDLAYPRWRICPEYDGRVHAQDAKQFEKDADRWDRIRAEGWDHVRVLNHHMRGNGRAAVAKIAEALIRAGWRP
ncbi:hypothetical protein ACFXQA_00410 [Microbacterium sp. P07]|uniref:hypothetical protein n=1 Tax=Microbacterium sp. P07 TaxID=3366952 RepID=UPI0037455EC4